MEHVKGISGKSVISMLICNEISENMVRFGLAIDHNAILSFSGDRKEVEVI